MKISVVKNKTGTYNVRIPNGYFITIQLLKQKRKESLKYLYTVHNLKSLTPKFKILTYLQSIHSFLHFPQP